MITWQHGTRGLALLALWASAIAADLPTLPILSSSPSPSPSPSTARLLADVAALSSATFEGRQTGTEADRTTAEFVAHRFSSLGLQLPPGSSALMAAPASVTTIAPAPRLEFHAGGTAFLAQPGSDYLPILDSPSVDLTAPLVFVGYGISDPDRQFDEYADVDVRGRVVLVLRGKPERYPTFLTHADKARIARAHGAVGVMTATPPVMTGYEARRDPSHAPKAAYGGVPATDMLPGAWISTDLAERLLEASEGPTKTPLRMLQTDLNTLTPRSRAMPVTVTLRWERYETSGTMYNVVGLLPGRDNRFDGGETVIVGAHRDHFGRQAGLVFHGADDNASGTAVLLEVARLLRDLAEKPKRSILFVSFSGEEQGLLGSKRYVDTPVVPLAVTRAMINVDHAGIGNGRLTVGVAGRPKDVALKAADEADLSQLIDVFGFFPGGDHVPFKEAGVPTVTIVSGGAHPNFHQPGDTVETINPDVLAAVTRYVAVLTWQLANE